MNSINFINELNEDQIKELFILGFAEVDSINEEEKKYNIKSIDEIYILSYISEKSFAINVYDAKNDDYKCSFYLNNFSMILEDEDRKYNLNNILKLYLAHEFDYRYIDNLYNKRVENANTERQILMQEAPNIFDKYGLVSLNDKKEKTLKKEL